MVISSEEAATTLLDKLGQDQQTAGSWKHSFQQEVLRLVQLVLPTDRANEAMAKGILKFK